MLTWVCLTMQFISTWRMALFCLCILALLIWAFYVIALKNSLDACCICNIFQDIFIHSFFHFPSTYPGGGWGSNKLRKSTQTSLSLATDSLLLGDPHLFISQLGESTRTWPGGILARCPNHLNWLLPIQRNSGCTLRFYQIIKLLTLSWRVSSATLWWDLSCTACPGDLMLSVTTHSSWLWVRIDW